MPGIKTRVEQLVEKLEVYNAAYREGKPLISDGEYDRLVEELRSVDPFNPFLNQVEPEAFKAKREVRHPIPMLSIEKAYSKKDLELFVERVEKEAAEIGVQEIFFSVTPKLDGLAGRDDGNVLVSRGNGETGYDITSAFQKGVYPIGGRGLGIGEVVIRKSYFEEHLSDKFEHPRNLVVGIINSDTLNEFAEKAIEDRAVRFVPYVELESRKVAAEDLLSRIEEVTEQLFRETDYPIDGMVVSVTDERVRDHMGATAHHYRWQIAVKTKGETAATTVLNVVWQVGRTGNVTPVLEVSPVSLSGAKIKRVTAHNAGKIKAEKIGPGAEIEIIRSGEVIPKLENVIQQSFQAKIPDKCPSCNSILSWDKDFLKCMASSCPAQVEQGIFHFFKILGTAEWFGIKTVQKLVSKGYDSLKKIYAMNEKDFLKIGFGPVQSKNLVNALNISREKPVEDWRFLAAFGIPDLGTGDSRKLLAHFHLEAFGKLKKKDIKNIHGFGPITSKSIINGIKKVWDEMQYMMNLGFTLERTPLEDERELSGSPIFGKGVVFTGKMKMGSREEMRAHAGKLGAKVQQAVTTKTDYLVCGEKAGASKVRKANEVNARVIMEDEYIELLQSD